MSTKATPESTPVSPASTGSAGGATNSQQQQQQSNSNSDSSSGPDLNSDSLGSDRGIAWWLFGCSALVFGMVSLGGLTRLTKSGLSMVEWKPTTFVPPRTEEEWNSEFVKYQQFPEYKRVNNQMSLEDFKFIYQMEFYHRLLGRTVGIAFAVPGLYFLARGRINRALGARLGVAFVAGGLQGAIGWWMVKSGLDNPHATQHSANVHVSPYRLATHLISAFAIYALLFSTALRVHPSTFSQRLLPNSASHKAIRELFAHPAVQKVRKLGIVTTVAVAATVFSGAFVAGNEAGLCYNEFPLMGGRIVPQDLISPYLTPTWRNAFENSTMVQFNHRVLAITTTGLIAATFIATRRLPKIPNIASLIESNTLVKERYARMVRAGHSWIGMAGVQVTLGISTLLLYVPVPLATLHQAGSLALLTISLWFTHTLSNPVAATVARLPRAGVWAQFSGSLQDLARGKVHRGTVYSALIILLAGNLVYQVTKIMEEKKQVKQVESEANKN